MRRLERLWFCMSQKFEHIVYAIYAEYESSESTWKAINTMDKVSVGGQKIRVGTAVTVDPLPEEVSSENAFVRSNLEIDWIHSLYLQA